MVLLRNRFGGVLLSRGPPSRGLAGAGWGSHKRPCGQKSPKQQIQHPLHLEAIKVTHPWRHVTVSSWAPPGPWRPPGCLRSARHKALLVPQGQRSRGSGLAKAGSLASLRGVVESQQIDTLGVFPRGRLRVAIRLEQELDGTSRPQKSPTALGAPTLPAESRQLIL